MKNKGYDSLYVMVCKEVYGFINVFKKYVKIEKDKLKIVDFFLKWILFF